MKRQPEALEPPEHYSVPNPLHGVKVKVQIMQRVKRRRADFAAHEKMAEIRATERPTRVAAAGGIGRPLVFGVARILDVEAALTGEQLPRSRVPGRQDAVEQVDA